MWILLHEISDQVVWYGERLSPDDWHDLFVSGRARVVPGLGRGELVVLRPHTRDMRTDEMTALIDRIRAFGHQHGVKFRAEACPGPRPGMEAA